MSLDFQQFKQYVSQINIGKQLPDAVYTHESAILELPSELQVLLSKICKALQIKESEWNLVKFYKRDFKIALLSYPDFDTYAYPSLRQSITVDLIKYSQRKADYSKSENPPILHRKETFVANDYPEFSEFKEITLEGENAELYTNTRTIGFKKNWERLIASKGYLLDEQGHLHRKGNEDISHIPSDYNGDIERHKTAIDRNQLSAPMKILAKHDYLDGTYSILDYGCGKGDDIRELEAHNIDCIGWDPVHQPENDLENCDIVNLGFVINVIEDRIERVETLKRAYSYTDKILVVTVMIAGDSVISQFKPYKDGVITSRNTFQKYYNQSEFKYFLEESLKESAIAVGQGIFLVFKDKIEEQNFLLKRLHIKRDWNQISKRIPTSPKKIVTKDIIEKHIELFNDFWDLCLDLGRLPSIPEFEFSQQLRKIAGSHKKAFDALVEKFGQDLWKQAIHSRKCDLLVYFALGLFEKRKPYKHMPESLKRDIKSFFDKYSTAIEIATEALFSVGNPSLIEELAISSYEDLKTGEFEDGHHWTIHKSILDKLPPELRIYIGCGIQYYGDIDEIDLIKIHFTSGKITLLRYDNWKKKEPLLVERIKIKLKEQDIDFFDYTGIYIPKALLNKSLY